MYEEIIAKAAASDWRAAAWMLEVLWVRRTKAGPEEESPTTMPLAQTAPRDPEQTTKTLAILVETFGREGAERILASRVAQDQRDQADGRRV